MTPEWYTPETEKKKTNPREFHIRGLDGLEALDIVGQITVENGELIVNGRALRSALNIGLIGIRTESGEEIHKDMLPTIDPLTLRAVAVKIINKTNLSGEEAKKS